ncbi:hypothetical protein NL676_021289 [Syzygium grande]|nr:hypothetical protein NL676_021289 [Syzygium grande]
MQDPTSAPVPWEKEGTVRANRLPMWNNQIRRHLVCFRPAKSMQCSNHLPLTPLENKLPLDPNSLLTQRRGCFIAKVSTRPRFFSHGPASLQVDLMMIMEAASALTVMLVFSILSALHNLVPAVMEPAKPVPSITISRVVGKQHVQMEGDNVIGKDCNLD